MFRWITASVSTSPVSAVVVQIFGDVVPEKGLRLFDLLLFRLRRGERFPHGGGFLRLLAAGRECGQKKGQQKES